MKNTDDRVTSATATQTVNRDNWWGGTRSTDNTTSKVSAAISNSSTATDKSQTKSVYEVHMSASHKVPLGMKMMLDFMTANISDSSPPLELSTDGYSTTQTKKSNILYQMGKM